MWFNSTRYNQTEPHLITKLSTFLTTVIRQNLKLEENPVLIQDNQNPKVYI